LTAWLEEYLLADTPFPVTCLIPFLNDSDEDTRSTATNALKAIDPEAAATAGVK
jgi:hypothetical protein